jgi:hypothetical protein
MSAPWAVATPIVASVTDVSDRPWSGITSASYATAAEYCAACLIDENELGSTHSKARCKLPVYEPRRLGGQLNRNAVHAAANRLVRERGGVQAPVAVKQAVARRLIELYDVIGDPPPRSLRDLAAGGPRRPSVRELGAGELDGPAR